MSLLLGRQKDCAAIGSPAGSGLVGRHVGKDRVEVTVAIQVAQPDLKGFGFAEGLGNVLE